MKLIFFGSDDFADAYLRKLSESSLSVVACVTQPDKPKGRGMKVVYSPIKETALERKIPILQPESVKDKAFIDELKEYNADLFIVIAYGRILPTDVLAIPKIAALNVHGSLLPKYRGAAPINWAVINGDKETGLTIIAMNPKMDAGKIVSQLPIAIKDSDTSLSVRKRMMDLGPQFLLSTIKNLKTDLPNAFAQDEKKVTFAPKMTKELGEIDWTKDAKDIVHLVRGLLPWPAAYTYFEGKSLKILQADVCFVDKKAKPGEVVIADKKQLAVCAVKGAVEIKMVHLESSKAMDAEAFLRGHAIKEGMILGK